MNETSFLELKYQGWSRGSSKKKSLPTLMALAYPMHLPGLQFERLNILPFLSTYLAGLSPYPSNTL